MVRVIFLLAVASALQLSNGCCPRNPMMNTAVSAHGNTDWHIDTANEFLFGEDMAGAVTAANHCPDSWTRQHLHVGLTNTSHFYFDPSKTTPGDDKSATDGIDQPMLFFYAGHGNPTVWNTLGDNGTQSNCLFGDCRDGTAGLRYYWQCSCEVFAHGPLTCPGGLEYGCPGDFDGSADSAAMRNVYERWGPAISPELRMACGASTLAYCHESQANSIWHNYNLGGDDVADSFINGLSGWGVVPLCITRGGADVTLTPLYDATFTNAANGSGSSYYHIQWGSSFAKQWIPPHIAIPIELPIYELKPLPLPEELKAVRLERSGGDLVSSDVDGFRMRLVPASGAIYLNGQRKPPVSGPALTEERYVEIAKKFLEQRGLGEADLEAPEAVRLMLQSRPVENGSKPSAIRTKGVTLTFHRSVKVGDARVPVVGQGGTIEVGMNTDGSIHRTAKVWRAIGATKRVAKVKTEKDALAEAQQKLGDGANAYEVDRWVFGYKEADGNATQSELRAVYQFAFVPTSREEMVKHAPRIVEIDAQAD